MPQLLQKNFRGAKINVVRSANTNMILAYWLIGREIVQELQGEEDRAEHGQQAAIITSEIATNSSPCDHDCTGHQRARGASHF